MYIARRATSAYMAYTVTNRQEKKIIIRPLFFVVVASYRKPLRSRPDKRGKNVRLGFAAKRVVSYGFRTPHRLRSGRDVRVLILIWMTRGSVFFGRRTFSRLLRRVPRSWYFYEFNRYYIMYGSHTRHDEITLRIPINVYRGKNYNWFAVSNITFSRYEFVKIHTIILNFVHQNRYWQQ